MLEIVIHKGISQGMPHGTVAIVCLRDVERCYEPDYDAREPRSNIRIEAK